MTARILDGQALAGRIREEPGHLVNRRQQVFEIVEHEQAALAAEGVGDRALDGQGDACILADLPRDGRGRRRRFPDPGEGDEPDSLEGGLERPGHPQGEAGLADPARPGQGDEPHVGALQQAADGIDFGGIDRVIEGIEEARVEFRGADNGLRVHAGDGIDQRSCGRVRGSQKSRARSKELSGAVML